MTNSKRATLFEKEELRAIALSDGGGSTIVLPKKAGENPGIR
ncbi:hypothetical protein QT973_13445 [Microcoleus sp. Z1_A1]